MVVKPSKNMNSSKAESKAKSINWEYGGFLSHTATPSPHPFIDGFSPSKKKHPATGVVPFTETSKVSAVSPSAGRWSHPKK